MMKKRQRFIGIVSGIALSLALVACGPQDEGGESTAEAPASNELLIWEDQEKSEGIEEAVAQFEAEHGVTVTVVEKPYAQQLEDLRLDGPAGTGPDVFTMPGDQIGTAVTEGLVKELVMGEDIQSLYTEAAMLSQIVDGKVYGLPKAVETTMLYYNKELISEDDLPETLDEWFDLSKEFREDDMYA